MIEIICRDNSIGQELLEDIAELIESTYGISVDVLNSDNCRAMVFWSAADVDDIIKREEMEIPKGVIEGFGDEYCFYEDNIREAEPEIHKEMLLAGKNVIYEELINNGIV